MGNVLHSQYEHRRALDSHKMALEIYIKSFKDDVRIVVNFRNMGILYFSKSEIVIP